MPLCPQITITPITVTTTGMTQSSVIAAGDPATTEQLSSVEILADGKTKVYRSATEPTVAGINDGDLWIDTNDGNKLYVRAGGVWVTAQDTSIATAQAAANAAANDAAIAQADATEALADAAIAYNAAVASLQPSASTIVNASNQITSISGNGINVFSGTGANSGPRVVLNSLGLAAYGTSSSFNITSASGNGTSVTYTATGHNFFVGQGVTVTELAPSGYNGSFIITAVAGSTFTVANTTTATVTDPNGFAIVSSVNVTNVSGNGTNVTYTASGHSFTVGQSVTVSGLAPSGYNGTFVITSVVASTSFTVANTTTAGVTDSNGSAERATFAISSTTGNAVFSGSITGSTIIGGTLNIAGNATINSSGLLTATGATITGTINAEAGYFGTPTNGFSISSTGLVGVGTGTIVGGAISGTTFTNGSTFSVTSAGVLTATSGTIGGFTLSSTGFTVSAIGVSINTNGNATFATVTTNTNQTNLFGGPLSVLDTITATGLITGNNGVTVTGAPVYTGTATSTASSQTEGIALTQGGTINARRSNNNPLNLHIFNVTAATTTSVPVIQFIRNGTNRGTLEVFGNTTAPTLVGSSDYRLKENIRDYTGALDKLMATKVRVFNEIEDDNKNDIIGFIAHEFAEIFPDFVNGEKDAVDENGNPIYQKLGYGNLVPHLIRAIQELKTEINLLKGE